VQRVVADWPRFRDAALDDAEEARRRHSPEGYQRSLAQEFAALRGAGDAVVSGALVERADAREAQ
jgi:hypothetical protein